MAEFITVGETMAVMVPKEVGPLKYCADYRLRIAGAESNTAIGVAKLGHTAAWVSSLGADAMGEYVLSAVRAEGVDVSGVCTDAAHRTGLMLKEMMRGETAVYYYRENSAASHMKPGDMPYAMVAEADILHLTGITPVLSASCMETAEALWEYAGENGALRSFDPNIRRKLWGERDFTDCIRTFLLTSDIALLGAEEAEVLLGEKEPEKIIKLLQAAGVRYIAIKDGSRGAVCADGEKTVFIPPEVCRPIEPVGAGDGFNAGFLCGVLENKEVEICGRMGAVAGAMATETTGDVEGYPTKQQMELRLAGRSTVYR